MPLPRPVWMLGWVSFFTDTASEMVYPLLPLFLTRVIGAGAMSIGVIEGIAEAASSVLKIVSGRLADRWGATRPLVIAGYGVSSAVRPFIALAGAWTHVLALRFTDRIGKGIRTAPRDAMLAAFAAAPDRGRVFGFHRAMDHAGAVCGPLVASAFLFFQPDAYRTLFALTIVPGLLVMLILARVPAGPPPGRETAWRLEPRSPPAGAQPGGGTLPGAFYRAMAVILLFSLGNASDAFLLLRFADVGVAAFWVPLLWSALHVVKSVASLAGGHWSDRHGRRTVIGLGWIVYAAVYVTFALTDTRPLLIAAFLVYGVYFGMTEGVERAWVTDLAPAAARGAAFGIYNALLGVGSLGASLLSGWLWTRVSPQAAFVTGAGFALAATALLYLISSGGPAGLRSAGADGQGSDTEHATDSGHQRRRREV